MNIKNQQLNTALAKPNSSAANPLAFCAYQKNKLQDKSNKNVQILICAFKMNELKASFD